jgi:hypothetical protein
MAHYAKVENGVVTQVIVADSKEWCQANLGGEWIQTSYNTHGGVNPVKVEKHLQKLRRYWIHLGWIRLCSPTTIPILDKELRYLSVGSTSCYAN